MTQKYLLYSQKNQNKSPIILGKNGKIFIVLKSLVYGKSLAEMRNHVNRVIFRFNGKKFIKYKTIQWYDSDTIIDGIVWK